MNTQNHGKSPLVRRLLSEAAGPDFDIRSLDGAEVGETVLYVDPDGNVIPCTLLKVQTRATVFAWGGRTTHVKPQNVYRMIRSEPE